VKRALALAAIALSVIVASPARADEDDKQICLKAYDWAQAEREKAHLLRAHAQLETCGRDVCPGPIKKDCIEWLAQVEASTPSLVIAVTDEHGRDLHDATVLIDGVAIDHPLDGRAIAVDPGQHTMSFEASGHKPAHESVIAREGEKLRRVEVRLEDVTITLPVEPAPRRPLVQYVGGGTALVALGVFGFFSLKGATEMWSLEDGCGKTKSCKQQDVDRAHDKLVVGDVALGVALVAAGITVYSLLTTK
jgi:hypothetical protein